MKSILPRTPILEIDHLSVSYRLRGKSIPAILDASLRIGPDEAVGLVGESGSGKSTLARAVLGLLPEKVGRVESGRIVVDGADVTHSSREQWERMRGHPVAIVFQDPLSYLNPLMKAGRQIAEAVKRHDPLASVPERVAELLRLVKLPVVCRDSFPHELSGGMRQRVLLAIALGCRPRLLIADEPTTALDVTTQAEILALLRELREKLSMALLLISHDLAVIDTVCSRIYVMYAGHTVEWGSAAGVFDHPAHPYTVALLQAARVLQDQNGRFMTIEGSAPKSTEVSVGCPFVTRCVQAVERCRREMPPPTVVGESSDHHARCWVSR